MKKRMILTGIIIIALLIESIFLGQVIVHDKNKEAYIIKIVELFMDINNQSKSKELIDYINTLNTDDSSNIIEEDSFFEDELDVETKTEEELKPVDIDGDYSKKILDKNILVKDELFIDVLSNNGLFRICKNENGLYITDNEYFLVSHIAEADDSWYIVDWSPNDNHILIFKSTTTYNISRNLNEKNQFEIKG